MGNNEKKSYTLSVCVCELSGCQVSLTAYFVSTIQKYFSILFVLQCSYYSSVLLELQVLYTYINIVFSYFKQLDFYTLLHRVFSLFLHLEIWYTFSSL